MKKVIIVESYAKTKTIRSFLRGEYDVIASGGHIADLPENSLGIDVDDKFSYTVVPIESRGKNRVEYLKNKLRHAGEIYLATDPDREGEAIAADILEQCVPAGIAVQRIEFNAIVYHAVKEALENPRNVDQDRVQAQRARRSLDRLIGFILSSVAKFDDKGPKLPAVGRVIAPAVSLVVDREKEITAFKPRHYWILHTELKHGTDIISARIKGEWPSFEKAKKTAERLTSTGTMSVQGCMEVPENKLNPLPPYTTVTLQNEADRLLRFSPEITMKLAQQLYQGVDIDGKSHALITYMRTDSTRVSPTAINLAKKAISDREDLGVVFYKGRSWNPRDAAQDAHEAIRPTMPEAIDFSPENLEDKLSKDLLELYRLIYFRFLASQMQPAVYHTVNLELEADDIKAAVEGHQLLSEGFLKAYRNVKKDHGWKETRIPALNKGTRLKLNKAWPEPMETKPPFRYREGSLVSELKDRGIGRPSTYSTTLKKIRDYNYVVKTGRTLKPTDRGRILCEFLNQKYEKVISYQYTAKMEKELSEIEKGASTYEDLLAREFEWLREPYEIASRKSWLDGDKPSLAQIQLLKNLAQQLGLDVPEQLFTSKVETSLKIDELMQLQKAQTKVFKLSPIEKVDVHGISCYRIRLFYTGPLADKERNFLKGEKMKYIAPEDGNPPCYQFQRQDRNTVENLRDRLSKRYAPLIL